MEQNIVKNTMIPYSPFCFINFTPALQAQREAGQTLKLETLFASLTSYEDGLVVKQACAVLGKH